MNLEFLFEDASVKEVNHFPTPPAIRRSGLRFVSPGREVRKEVVKQLPTKATKWQVYQDRANDSFVVLYTTDIQLNEGAMKRLREALI
jgi:hypothetical protein